MRKNDQSIYLLSFIIVSAIVLAFLYIPLGGNISNSSNGYYVETAPSVNFGGSILNSPKQRLAHNSYSSSDNDLFQSVNSSKHISQRHAITSGGATQNMNMIASNGYSANGIGHSSSVGTSSYGALGGGRTGMMDDSGSGRIQSNGNSSGGSRMMAVSGGGMYQSTGGGGAMMAPFSGDIETNNNLMQKSGTDPGDDEDLGNPIPLGDGSWLLLLFTAIYLIIKNKAKL